jgi:hypothetical protein
MHGVWSLKKRIGQVSRPAFVEIEITKRKITVLRIEAVSIRSERMPGEDRQQVCGSERVWSLVKLQ